MHLTHNQNIMKKTLLSLFALCLAAMPMSGAETSQPRPEYPRPQFQREQWQNLNGPWSYTFDFSKSGHEQGLQASKGFKDNIIVTFCPESDLSGVGHKDFIEDMWYHRKLDIPAEWAGKHILLNFGAVDYRSKIYINGVQVADHTGGSSSFSIDISRYVTPGRQADLVVAVHDNLRDRTQTAGKQSECFNSYGCKYTRVTGIWQTVWLEPVEKGGLKQCRITPDLDNSQFVFEPEFYDLDGASKFRVRLLDKGKEVFSKTVPAGSSSFVVAPVKNAKIWSPETPNLYDVEYAVLGADGKVIDSVKSYAGMRKVEVRGNKFYLNNKPYFMRLVLDQGYYPDGVWTAPSDDALRADIEMGKRAGFNGARLHQKVFEPRYYYWADRLGYLCWGESASWGMDFTSPVAARNFLMEWEECVNRDYNAPSLVAWSPLNETWQDDNDYQRARMTNDLYLATHRIDRTRPVVTTSGGYHAGLTDIYAEHNYEGDPVKFYLRFKDGEKGTPYVANPTKSAPYKGEAYILDEFGGIGWYEQKEGEEAWGYNNQPKDLEEFYARLEGLVNVLLSLDHMQGYCYTQLTDVEQEKNGIYTYKRGTKFDMDRINKIFSKSREQARREVAEMLRERGVDAPELADN